jgi:hypothetical protein
MYYLTQLYKFYNNYNNRNDINKKIIHKLSNTYIIKIKECDKNEKSDKSETKIIKIKDTQVFKLPITTCQVISVSNDYSILVATQLFDNGTLYRFIVRFNNITIPDRYGSFDERSISNFSKKELTHLLLHKIVTLKNINYYKYDELFADVYLDDLCINTWLINERYATTENNIKPVNWLSYKLNKNYE